MHSDCQSVTLKVRCRPAAADAAKGCRFKKHLPLWPVRIPSGLCELVPDFTSITLRLQFLGDEVCRDIRSLGTPGMGEGILVRLHIYSRGRLRHRESKDRLRRYIIRRRDQATTARRQCPAVRGGAGFAFLHWMITQPRPEAKRNLWPHSSD